MIAENKLVKYLIYAIGEIILVVIGILIALSINNWNENVKKLEQESLLVKNINEDLKTDAAQFKRTLNELDDQVSIVDNLISKIHDNSISIKYDSTALIRYSSDFRPISQKNHSVSVSELENDESRNLLQNYFIKEDQVKDIFLEYERIVHNNIRPYLREVGMHNLKSLNNARTTGLIESLLHNDILEQQLAVTKFQQFLFERRLKTDSFRRFLNQIIAENQALIEALK